MWLERQVQQIFAYQLHNRDDYSEKKYFCQKKISRLFVKKKVNKNTYCKEKSKKSAFIDRLKILALMNFFCKHVEKTDLIC